MDKDLLDQINAYKLAAEQGSTKAQLYLANLYLQGVEVERDSEQGKHYLTMAADQGFAIAQELLGTCYLNGSIVAQIVPDDAKATHYLELAAEQGHFGALDTLGDCYAEGRAVTKDITKALDYYQRAVKEGCERSQDKINKLKA